MDTLIHKDDQECTVVPYCIHTLLQHSLHLRVHCRHNILVCHHHYTNIDHDANHIGGKSSDVHIIGYSPVPFCPSCVPFIWRMPLLEQIGQMNHAAALHAHKLALSLQ